MTVIIEVELEELQEQYKHWLDNIRWQHIDMNQVLAEELQDHVQAYVKSLIRAYGEGE